jgi:hypothetical protein
MARYIKVNPKVAQYLHLENDRNQVKDGNYLLWQADMLAFGRLTELPQILEQIGGIALAANEARQEQDGTVVRELPTATDSRFIVEKDEPVSEETTEQPDTDETVTENTGETGTEQPTDEGQAEETEAEPDDTGTEETAESETETTNETDM